VVKEVKNNLELIVCADKSDCIFATMALPKYC
jgi:hypothetical protein